MPCPRINLKYNPKAKQKHICKEFATASEGHFNTDLFQVENSSQSSYFGQRTNTLKITNKNAPSLV